MESTELFDRENDMDEKVSIAAQHSLSIVVEGLSEQLADGWLKAKPDYRE